MKCPVCSVELRMTERQGVEIDYCPQCRGVWLDRGELDKIIDRSGDDDDRGPRPDERSAGYGRPHDHEHRESYKHHGKPYKKKSIWREIFDFD